MLLVQSATLIVTIHWCVQAALCAKANRIVRDEPSRHDLYNIGFGIADITGPSAEINMMGYARLGQDTRGIHTRLYSRAAVIVDENGTRVCYVNVDLAGVTQVAKLMVIQKLQETFGEGVYDHENVMITATHTHSGPGGYFQYLLYIITQKGFIKESLAAIVSGIVKSIVKAHDQVVPGHIFYHQGLILDASINRSPAAYLANPLDERERYKYNTEKMMQMLKFVDVDGKPLGVMTWYAVHGTSMNNSNKLISSDNKGYAAMRMEQHFNGYVNVGKGPFVAIFAQANEGDSSPNTKGARCLSSGLPCDFVHSTCPNKSDTCVAFGPGKDMFESTKMIGQRQYEKAKEMLDKRGDRVKGAIQYIYENINMTSRDVTLPNATKVKTCPAALGFSFAAGTTDGEGSNMFQQGTLSGQENEGWDLIRNFITRPSKELLECHKPKAVFLPVGEMKYPYQWTPEILPTQIIQIGSIVLASLPGEFTTMAGRRLKQSILDVYRQKGLNVQVVLAGLGNSYSNYVTTFEEYQVQRYEGGSTLFGPYTLDAYREQYAKLASSMLSHKKVPRGPEFPNLLHDEISLKPGVFFDRPLENQFGHVLTEVQDRYYAGSRVKVRFSGANPRNNLRLDGTFLTIERLVNEDEWQVVAVDGNWETMFIWNRVNVWFGTSEVIIVWDIPLDTPEGTYRIRYFGDSKSIIQTVSQFAGSTKPFKVISIIKSVSM